MSRIWTTFTWLLVSLVLVVRFKGQANFHYCPSCIMVHSPPHFTKSQRIQAQWTQKTEVSLRWCLFKQKAKLEQVRHITMVKWITLIQVYSTTDYKLVSNRFVKIEGVSQQRGANTKEVALYFTTSKNEKVNFVT